MTDGSPLIVIIENDEAIRGAVSSLVRSARYRCAAFASAEAFLESGKFDEVSCVLLDVRLPGMDGFDLHLRLNEMSANQIRGAIPVIYVTAARGGTLRERALHQGAAAWFPKPFDHEGLLSAIGGALNKSALAKSPSTGFKIARFEPAN